MTGFGNSRLDDAGPAATAPASHPVRAGTVPGAPAGAGRPGVAALYPTIMGAAFDRLHPALRRFHTLQGRNVLHGRVVIEPPRHRVGRWLARLMATPVQAHDGPLRFVLDARPGEEHWCREFPGRTMRSCLRSDGPRMVEQLGAVRLVFALEEHAGALRMRLQSLRCLGLPCPRWLLPDVRADEHGECVPGGGERLHFDVHAALPFVGRVAHYRGWLELAAAEVLP